MRIPVRWLVLMTAAALAACPSSPTTESLAVTPGALALQNGELRTLTTKVLTGSSETLAIGATWTTNNEAVATVSSTGDGNAAVQAVGVGLATLTVKLRSATALVAVTVSAREVTLSRIDITPAQPTLARGTSQQLTATGVFSDASTRDLTAMVAWASSDEAVASFSGSGLLTALQPGTSTISALQGSVEGQQAVTVTAAALVAIEVSPLTPTVAKGTTLQLVATARFADATTQDVSAQVTWASVDAAVVSVSAVGLVTGQVPGSATVSASVNGVTGSTTVTVSAATLETIELTPPLVTVAQGATAQLTATGRFSDGSTQDIGAQASWRSSDSAVGPVSSTGLVSGLNAGTTSITAAVGAVSGSAQVTVKVAQLVSLTLTPARPSLARGLTLGFTATGTYDDSSTRDLTAQVTWSSSAPGVASISNAAGTRGLATGQSLGTTTITAISASIAGSTTLTVTAASLSSLRVAPAAPSVPRGLGQQLTATGLFSDGSALDLTTSVTWVSSSAAVANVSNAAGTEGLLIAVAPGTADVSASLGGVVGSTTVTVTPAQLVSIVVTGAPTSLPRGRTADLVATGTYTDATTAVLTTQVTWTASLPTVASVSNALGTQGRVTGLSPGTTSITATSGTVSGAAALQVVAAVLDTIAVTPTAPSVAKGRTQQLTATGTYSDATTQNLTATATWMSSSGGVATVASTGLATTLTVGTSTVSAAVGAVSGSTLLTVSAAALDSIVVTPANPSLAKGRTQQLLATGTWSDLTTTNLTASATWNSATPGVATVSNVTATKGLATAVNPGSALLTATVGAVSGGTTVSVTIAVLDSIAVTPLTPTVAKGLTRQFTATGTYSDATTQNLTTTVSWASTTTSAVTVSNMVGTQGLAQAVAVGGSTVSATLGAVTGSTVMTVGPAALVSITLSPLNPSVAKGRTRQFTATGTYTDATTADLTSSVTWASTSGAVASIASTGLASALNVGATSISATLGTVSSSTTLNVTPAVLDTIAVTPVTPSVAKGLTRQFVATGTYSDLTTQNLSATATWASATPGVATIVSGGLATAATVGTSNISATVGPVNGTTLLTVTPAQLVSIAITPVAPTLNAGSTVQLTATGTYTDSSTQNLSATATWGTGSGAIATVSSTGLVTGTGGGSTPISATVGTVSNATTVTVSAPPPVVLATVPSAGVTAVSALAPLSFTFDRALAPASVTVQSAGGACSGSVQVSRDDFASCLGLGAPVLSAGDTVVTVGPAPALAFGASYKTRVTPSLTSAFSTPASAFTLASAFTTAVDSRCAAGLVISQLYGAGGNSGALYTHDFVELHNPTSSAISVAGFAVQYASATGNAWSVTTLAGSVPAGGYYLVQLATGGAVGAVMPTPDATGTSNISGSVGKLALTSSTTALTGNCPTAWVDFVGYGTTADCFRTARAPAPSATTVDLRKRAGCTDENDNSQDFTAAAPAPRNSGSAPVVCACSTNETDRPDEADYCALRFPPTLLATTATTTALVYGRLFEAGVTEPAGGAATVRAELGFGPATVNPQNQPGFVWTPATFNLQAGNDDEYQAAFTAPAPGAWRYTARFSFDGTNWTYCDLDGAGSNPALVFDPGQLGVLTVTP